MTFMNYYWYMMHFGKTKGSVEEKPLKTIFENAATAFERIQFSPA